MSAASGMAVIDNASFWSVIFGIPVVNKNMNGWPGIIKPGHDTAA